MRRVVRRLSSLAVLIAAFPAPAPALELQGPTEPRIDVTIGGGITSVSNYEPSVALADQSRRSFTGGAWRERHLMAGLGLRISRRVSVQVQARRHGNGAAQSGYVRDQNGRLEFRGSTKTTITIGPALALTTGTHGVWVRIGGAALGLAQFPEVQAIIAGGKATQLVVVGLDPIYWAPAVDAAIWADLVRRGPVTLRWEVGAQMARLRSGGGRSGHVFFRTFPQTTLALGIALR